jgi:hypothetical protein
VIDSSSASFFTLVKSLLRPDHASPEQKESARQACSWLNDNIGQVRRYTQDDHCTLLGLIWDHFTTHKECPNREILGYEVAQEAKAGLTTLYSDFLESDLADHSGWVRHEPEDLPALWATVVDEFKMMRMVKMLQNAVIVTTKGVELKKGPEKILYKGPDAAIRYIWERVDAIALGTPGGVPTHGSLNGMVDRVASLYAQADQPGNIARAQYTGLRQLDALVRPTRGQLIGVAGYAKSGKTRFGRTWNYHSICEGLNVLHLTYEQSFDEELIMYAIIHSWNRTFYNEKWMLSYQRYIHQGLTRDEKDFLKTELIPDLRDRHILPGNLLIRQPSGDGSWGDVMVQTTLTNHQVPLDRLWIDYLTAIPVTDRDERVAYNRMLQEAKLFGMNFDNGRGLLVATPLQVNRESWTKAGEAGGRYEANCCYMYSQVEKAVDTLYYVYGDDKLSAENRVILGTCVDRHNPLVQPFKVAVEHACGTFHNHSAEFTQLDENKVLSMELL